MGFGWEDVAQFLYVVAADHLIVDIGQALAYIFQSHLTQLNKFLRLQHRLISKIQPSLLKAFPHGSSLKTIPKPKSLL